MIPQQPGSTQPSLCRLLIVGNPLPFHVGGYFINAAKHLGLQFQVADVRQAEGPSLLQKVWWRIFDKSYVLQGNFESSIKKYATSFQPTLALTIGICPIRAQTINSLRLLGIRCVNFLTDDPFNKLHACKWFLKSLPQFDTIYSPRRANIGDLQSTGCHDVRYLPFAYDQDLHYPVQESVAKPFDVLFVGGADEDRVPYLRALGEAGIKVLVLGGYWDRWTLSNVTVGGHATIEQIREASAKSRISLILVRRNNRDGHVMRTFEAAAMGGCLVVEKTEEHTSIFGSGSAAAVHYFNSVIELRETVLELLRTPEKQEDCRAKVVGLMSSSPNTYTARLREIIGRSDQSPN